MAYLLDPVVRSWGKRKLEFRLPGGSYLTHRVWRDNVFVIAPDWAQWIAMVADITRAMAARGFSWKPDSLQSLTVGITALPPDKCACGSCDPSIAFQRVSVMPALGTLLVGY